MPASTRLNLTAIAAAAGLGLVGLVDAAAAAPADLANASDQARASSRPTSHYAISGGNFHATSGDPGCFTGAGSKMANIPLRRGASVAGATAYVIDESPAGSITVRLERHDLATGQSVVLAEATTEGAVGASVLELAVDPAAVIGAGQSLNARVGIVAGGVCFKGVDVHFARRTPSGPTDPDAPSLPTDSDIDQDGARG